MRKQLLVLLMALCMVVAFMPLTTVPVSAVTVTAPTITSLSSEGYTDGTLVVRIDNSANSAILSNTSIQIENMTAGESAEVAGNVSKYTFQNLTRGRTYQVRARTCYYDRSTGSYSYSSWSPIKSAVVGGSSTDGEQIKLNTWYRGTTLEQPEYFKVKTTGRTDSKYKFFVRTTYAKLDWFQTNIEMVSTGKTLGYAAFYELNSEQNIYAPLQTLKPNTTYKFQVYGSGSALGCERDVDYEFIVKEIIAKPAKGKVTYWKGGKKKATLKFAKLAKATRYQVACKKKGGSYKYRYFKSNKPIVFKNLSKKKYYYVKVRGQRLVNGVYYSGPWSTVKSTKTK